MIHCIIVDDEPLAREGLELLVRETGFLHLTALCSDALEANKVLSNEKIDLIFLDIQMPKISGLDFLKSLPVKPLTIITTAYPNFALQGFELNVLDYLVKPITPERFLKAANRAREMMESRNPDNSARQEYFFIKCNNGYEKIFYQDILYIEACQNYSAIHTQQAKWLTLTSMKSLEEQLPAGKFLRVQKSYIVAIEKIQSLSGNELLVHRHKIPVSKNYKDALMALIDKNLLKK